MKRFVWILMVAALVLSLGGCVLEPAESLYVIPAQPAEFYHLQDALEELLVDGVSYSGPTAGENQQPVQLADLDGDEEEEAVVYLRGSGDCPLSLCVFDREGESYRLLVRLECAGSAFDRVQYVQLDGAPGYEIVVGRQISDLMTQTLDVYSMRGDSLVQLLNTNYSQFITTDLNGDSLTDLVVLSADGGSATGLAEYYRWQEGELLRDREAGMSAQVSAVKRIITGEMCRGIPAVFVASEYGEGTIITDIFGLREGVFSNLSRTEDGVKTLRDYYVYSCDIDNDGLIELPRLIPLTPLENDESSANRSLIRWYNLQEDGSEREKCLTYHSYAGGWYLTVPEEWAQTLSVSQHSVLGAAVGHRFSLEGAPAFSLAALSGEAAEKTAEDAGWQLLTRKGDVAYVVRLEGEQVGLETLRPMFQFIPIDWKTGETE